MMTVTMIYSFQCFSENLYSQVDLEGYQFFILEKISNHWSDGMDVDVADGFIISRGEKNIPWKLRVGGSYSIKQKKCFQSGCH